ncbi:MAG: T9SS type A sorting domain-containing protein [Bacteroidota bacterium]|nr:T9SS type A sorting domain-containing protein [Bacteroidota bacterium]MDP4232005.1 T9SS type A sorting domain-containing protein [Bacteroidota bacterium]MDP4241288.1 T9SS type A sorting domain-containing protein [Bacteroidota bacterium]MDP4286680.1 T9SS type A sorting domain-containing protein [Bacteroidota bacterium]
MHTLRLLSAAAMILFASGLVRADSFSHTPDTVTFSPQQGQTSLTAYVRAAYNGDTTQPGTTVHAWISSGNSYFSVDTNRHYFKSMYYWLVTYHVQSSAVTGAVALSDDTATQHVVLIAHAPTPAPDGYLTGVGPYFSTTHEDSTSCTYLQMINTGSDLDTIVSAGWTHNPNGIFTWDTSNISFPLTIPSHDTVRWNFCFHAPHDTNYHIDTFVVYYHDSASQTRSVSRVVMAKATGPAPDGEISGYGPYFSSTQMDSTSCTTLRLINTGADRDTIVSAGWAHNPNGVFIWDTSNVTLPRTLNSHDTLLWNFCFHAPSDTSYRIDTFIVYYHDSASQTRSITRVVYGRAASPAPDGYISGVGPYFPTTKEGSTGCTTMRMINTGNDMDTIVSAGWTHNSNGIFAWDTSNISLPTTLTSHDTLLWNFCFNAPNDTNVYRDTFVVYYHDAYSQTRYFSRVVTAHAVDSSLQDCYYIYPQTSRITEVGDTSYIHVYISNRLDSSVNLTALHIGGSGDAAYRVDSSTFPHTIAGHHYDSLWIAFIPTAGTSNYFPATITGLFTSNDTTHCKAATASLAGHSALYANDTQTVNFNDTGTATVNLSGDSGWYSHRIEFVNNASVSLLVHSIVLTNTSHFYIAQTLPATPDTVTPGKKISVIVHFYGDSSGTTFRDTIVVDIDHALTSFYVYVKGQSPVIRTSGVATSTSAWAELRIYPNPTRGTTSLDLAGVSTATYEVLDMLGTVIATYHGAGPWQWNPENVADGTYYVRADGRDATGHEFITTRRIILTR